MHGIFFIGASADSKLSGSISESTNVAGSVSSSVGKQKTDD